MVLMAKRVSILFAAILMTFAMCFAVAPSAFAGNVNGNVAYNDNAENLNEQTIVGEGSDNHVIVTNTASNPPSATGFVMANAPIFVVAAIVILGGALFIVKTRRHVSSRSKK